MLHFLDIWGNVFRMANFCRPPSSTEVQIKKTQHLSQALSARDSLTKSLETAATDYYFQDPRGFKILSSPLLAESQRRLEKERLTLGSVGLHLPAR